MDDNSIMEIEGREKGRIKPDRPINCPVCSSRSFTLVIVRFDSGRIVRCLNCGHIYLNPTYSDEALGYFYDRYYLINDCEAYLKKLDSWVADPEGIYQYAINIILQSSGFTGKRMLDVGCGCGRFLYECRKLGASVSGIDMNPQAARIAKKYFDIDIIQNTLEGSMDSLIRSNSLFNTIFAFEIIEHVREPGKFLRNLYKLLEPGGLLFVTTPNFYLYYLMGRSAPAVREFTVHINFFEPKTIEKLLRQSGFEIIKITTLNPLNYGDRLKERFARYFVGKSIWHTGFLKRIYLFRNTIFNMLNKYKHTADVKQLNGKALVVIARKPNC